MAGDGRYTLADYDWYSLADAAWYIIVRSLTLAKVAGVGGVGGVGNAFSFGRDGVWGKAPREQVEPPPADWQARMYTLVADAEDRLFSDAGQPALDYITSRGILSWTAREACLGYVTDPEPRLLMPYMIGGQVWSIKWRSLVGKKYGLYEGSRLGAPYLMDWWTKKRILLVVEGELDALLAYGKISDLCDVTTLGSATARLAPQFISQIKAYGLVLVCTDADDSGDKCAEYWYSIAGNAYKRLRPVGAKDLGEMWANGGDVRQWIISEGMC